MIYISSPFYGHYESFISLMKAIDFKEDDVLFILGNAIGHDSDSMKLLTELTYRTNVYLLMGKQEYYAKNLLPKLSDASDFQESFMALNDEDRNLFGRWIKEGGYNFARDFFNLDEEEKEAILDYLNDLDEVTELEQNGRHFVISYASPVSFNPDMDIYDYPEGSFALGDTDYSKKYFTSKFTMTACKATDLIPGGKFAKVYSGPCKHISLATLDPSQGRPSAIRLDDMKVLYGELLDVISE